MRSEASKTKGNEAAEVVSMKTTEERFWAKVDKAGPVMPGMRSRCWVWTGAKTNNRYGVFFFNSRLVLAHRVAHELFVGHTNLHVLHRCDNKSCVRPGHLQAGTHAQNMKEKAERGFAYGGERHHRCKLSNEQVRDIRHRHREGESQVSLARSYAVDPSHISGIVNNKKRKRYGLPI